LTQRLAKSIDYSPKLHFAQTINQKPPYETSHEMFTQEDDCFSGKLRMANRREYNHMKKYKLLLTVFALVVIVAQLCLINYTNIVWSNNVGHYLGIIAMLLVIISVVCSNRGAKKQEAND